MNYLFLTLSLILISFNSFEQENKEIELQKITRTTFGGSSGSSTYFQWRLSGSQDWMQVGRKYKNVAPYLNKFEDSKLLLKQSNNYRVFGRTAGFLLIGGGFITTFSGLLSSQDTHTIDPVTNEVIIVKGSKSLGYVGIGMLAAGVYTNFITGRISMKKFQSSCETYNSHVKKETSYIKGIEYGLTGSDFSYYPSFRLQFSL